MADPSMPEEGDLPTSTQFTPTTKPDAKLRKPPAMEVEDGTKAVGWLPAASAAARARNAGREPLLLGPLRTPPRGPGHSDR